MAFNGYIKDMGISLGRMLYAGQLGASLQDSLIGDMKLSGYETDASGLITGNATVNVSDSR